MVVVDLTVQGSGSSESSAANSSEKVKKAKKSKVPWWSCLEKDDDEEVSTEKAAKKYERMGKRQYGFLAGAYLITLVLSIFFCRAPASSSSVPTIVTEFAAASMDMAKKGVQFIPQEYQLFTRCGAYLALPGVFAASQLVTVPNAAFDIGLKAVPWIYPSMGVLRSDLVQHLNIDALLKLLKADINYPRLTVFLDTTLKASAATGLMLSGANGYLTAGASVVYKGEIRRWVDLAEKNIVPLKGPWQKVALATFFGTLTALSVAGGINMYYGNWPALNAVFLIPAIDTGIRTLKSNIKTAQKERKKAIQQTPPVPSGRTCYVKEGLKIGGMAAFLAGLGALTAFVGAGNANFGASLLIDIVSVVKLASKEMSPYAIMSLAGFYMAVAASTYSAKEFLGQEVAALPYIILLGIAAVAYSTSMYQVRKQVVPPKKPKLKKETIPSPIPSPID